MGKYGVVCLVVLLCKWRRILTFLVTLLILLDSCIKLGLNDLEEMKSKYVVWIYHSGFLLIGVLIVGVIAASCIAVAFYLTVGSPEPTGSTSAFQSARNTCFAVSVCPLCH